MNGNPKILQTREDFDWMLAAARTGEVIASHALPHFQGLLEAAFAWEFVRNLADGEDHSEGADEWIEVAEEAGATLRRLLTKVIDDGARLFTLGYSIEEVRAIITELEA